MISFDLCYQELQDCFSFFNWDLTERGVILLGSKRKINRVELTHLFGSQNRAWIDFLNVPFRRQSLPGLCLHSCVSVSKLRQRKAPKSGLCFLLCGAWSHPVASWVNRTYVFPTDTWERAAGLSHFPEWMPEANLDNSRTTLFHSFVPKCSAGVGKSPTPFMMLTMAALAVTGLPPRLLFLKLGPMNIMRWIFTGTFKGRLRQRGIAFYSYFPLFVHNLNILSVNCSFHFVLFLNWRKQYQVM